MAHKALHSLAPLHRWILEPYLHSPLALVHFWKPTFALAAPPPKKSLPLDINETPSFTFRSLFKYHLLTEVFSAFLI